MIVIATAIAAVFAALLSFITGLAPAVIAQNPATVACAPDPAGETCFGDLFDEHRSGERTAVFADLGSAGSCDFWTESGRKSRGMGSRFDSAGFALVRAEAEVDLAQLHRSVSQWQQTLPEAWPKANAEPVLIRLVAPAGQLIEPRQISRSATPGRG